MATMDAGEVSEGVSGEFPLCSWTPSERAGYFFSRRGVDVLSVSGHLHRLGIDANKLIFQLPPDANKIRSQNRRWVVIPLLSA